MIDACTQMRKIILAPLNQLIIVLISLLDALRQAEKEGMIVIQSYTSHCVLSIVICICTLLHHYHHRFVFGFAAVSMFGDSKLLLLLMMLIYVPGPCFLVNPFDP